jgi:hypothetical protein
MGGRELIADCTNERPEQSSVPSLVIGFTHPTDEFTTPYRVINWHACDGRWNDLRVRFHHKDSRWCARPTGSPRQFEYTRLITAEQVIATLNHIPDRAWQLRRDPPTQPPAAQGSKEPTP